MLFQGLVSIRTAWQRYMRGKELSVWEGDVVCLPAQCILYYDSFKKDWIRPGMVVHSYNLTT